MIPYHQMWTLRGMFSLPRPHAYFDIVCSEHFGVKLLKMCHHGLVDCLLYLGNVAKRKYQIIIQNKLGLSSAKFRAQLASPAGSILLRPSLYSKHS